MGNISCPLCGSKNCNKMQYTKFISMVCTKCLHEFAVEKKSEKEIGIEIEMAWEYENDMQEWKRDRYQRFDPYDEFGVPRGEL